MRGLRFPALVGVLAIGVTLSACATTSSPSAHKASTATRHPSHPATKAASGSPVTTPTTEPGAPATTTATVPPTGAQSLPSYVVTLTPAPVTTCVGQAPATAFPDPPGVWATGTDGSLGATLAALPATTLVGSPVTFIQTFADCDSTGFEGPWDMTYGDGQTSWGPPPLEGWPARCNPSAGAQVVPTQPGYTTDYSHTYSSPGTYTVAVKFLAPCTGESVPLALSITVLP